MSSRQLHEVYKMNISNSIDFQQEACQYKSKVVCRCAVVTMTSAFLILELTDRISRQLNDWNEKRK